MRYIYNVVVRLKETSDRRERVSFEAYCQLDSQPEIDAHGVAHRIVLDVETLGSLKPAEALDMAHKITRAIGRGHVCETYGLRVAIVLTGKGQIVGIPPAFERVAA